MTQALPTLLATGDVSLQVLTRHHPEEYFTQVEANREWLSRYFEWPDHCRTLKDASDYLHRCAEQFASNQAWHFGIFVEDSLVGCIGLTPRAGLGIEMGAWLAQGVAGKGVISKAGTLLISFAFNRLHLPTLVARCQVTNRPSRWVIGQLGFTSTGPIEQCEFRGEQVDCLSFALANPRAEAIWERRIEDMLHTLDDRIALELLESYVRSRDDQQAVKLAAAMDTYWQKVEEAS